MGTYYRWTNPKLGSCYNPYLLLCVTMSPGSGSIAVEPTPQWGCVATCIHMPWWTPITVDLTPSWGPVTTRIYFSQFEKETHPEFWKRLLFLTIFHQINTVITELPSFVILFAKPLGRNTISTREVVPPHPHLADSTSKVIISSRETHHHPHSWIPMLRRAIVI